MGGREQSMANSENEKKPEKIKQTETRIHMLTMNEKKKPTSHKYIMGPLLQQIYTGFYVQYRFEKSCTKSPKIPFMHRCSLQSYKPWQGTARKGKVCGARRTSNSFD